MYFLDVADVNDTNLQKLQCSLADFHAKHSKLLLKFDAIAEEVTSLKNINIELLGELKKINNAVRSSIFPKSTSLSVSSIQSLPAVSSYANVVQSNLVVVKP